MLPHRGVLASEDELGEEVVEAEARLMPATPRPVGGAARVAEDSSSGDFMIDLATNDRKMMACCATSAH